MNLLARLATTLAVIAVAIVVAAPYVRSLVLPVVVLAAVVYLGRLIWWYTQL